MRFPVLIAMAALLLASDARVSIALAQSCPGPYRVVAPDGRCVWSCAPGTRPDAATNTCVCQQGLSETSASSNGRRVCSAPADSASGDRRPEPRRPAGQSAIAANYPFATRPHRLCGTYGRREHPFPYRCTETSQPLRQFRIERRLFITVYKSTPLRADMNQAGRYTMHFNRPPDPPRNRDCDPAVTGARGACDPTCYRVEYIKLRDSGELHALLRATGRGGDDCAGSLTTDYQTDNPGKALGYDRCWAEAARRDLGRWNHNVEIMLPRRVAAAYGFKDAHTSGTHGNWRYQLQIQHRMLFTNVELPVTVRCRE